MGKVTFRQSDLTRAIVAATKAGQKVREAIISPDGEIRLLLGGDAEPQERPLTPLQERRRRMGRPID